MNAPTTRRPTASRSASVAERPGPCAATVPETSWPSTHGVGKRTSAFTTCRSVWQTPHAATLISTSPVRGSGVRISSRAIGSRWRSARPLASLAPPHRAGLRPAEIPSPVACTRGVGAPPVILIHSGRVATIDDGTWVSNRRLALLVLTTRSVPPRRSSPAAGVAPVSHDGAPADTRRSPPPPRWRSSTRGCGPARR